MKSINLCRIFTAVVFLFAIGNSSSAQDTSLKKTKRVTAHISSSIWAHSADPLATSRRMAKATKILNDSGVIAFSADTSIPDPNAPDSASTFIQTDAL